jgi:hypothetical protein
MLLWQTEKGGWCATFSEKVDSETRKIPSVFAMHSADL